MSDRTNAVWVSRIPELLEAKGELLGRRVSPEELADYVGVTRQTVYTWMSPQGVPTIAAKWTIRLMRFFGVPEWRLWKLTEAEQEDEPGQEVALAAT